MPGLLLARSSAERYADVLEGYPEVEVIVPPEDPEGQLSEEQLDRIEGAFLIWDGPAAEQMRRVSGIARRAPNLRWVHWGHAGTDSPLVQQMMDRDVVITNSSGVTAEPIALTAIAGMLALHRGFHLWVAAQRQHQWVRHQPVPPDLRGQTITVLGLGSIGCYVAQFARGLGMRVVGVRRSPAGPEDGVDEWVQPDRLMDVLPRTNVLAVTIPLTSQTRGLVGRDALAALPPGALLLNVARGAICDEDAVIEALQSGHLGGAYLDVFAVEPLPDDSPLWDMPNVFVSPHDAGRSAGNGPRTDEIFAEELGRWLRGEESPRRVLDR